MLKPVIDFVAAVYDLVGDLGLAYFLVIVIINIYYFCWQLPRKLQSRGNTDSAEARTRSLNIRIFFGLPSLIFGTFIAAILIVPGPALWIKLLSVTVFIVLLMCFVTSIWLFISTKISSITS